MNHRLDIIRVMAEQREQECIDNFCAILLACTSPIRKEYVETIITSAKHKYRGAV